MASFEFRENLGVGQVTIFEAEDMRLEADCTGNLFDIRSRDENGTVEASTVDSTPPDPVGSVQPSNSSSDDDFDTNESVNLAPGSSPLQEGHFAFSSVDGGVVTGVYIFDLGFANPQGDCVIAGTANLDPDA
ncbi:MAG TPA: hypothetical protein VF711_05830 [Acidimicrobiales bacterium]